MLVRKKYLYSPFELRSSSTSICSGEFVYIGMPCSRVLLHGRVRPCAYSSRQNSRGSCVPFCINRERHSRLREKILAHGDFVEIRSSPLHLWLVFVLFFVLHGKTIPPSSHYSVTIITSREKHSYAFVSTPISRDCRRSDDKQLSFYNWRAMFRNLLNLGSFFVVVAEWQFGCSWHKVAIAKGTSAWQ